MTIRLIPVNDENREAVLALSVREDQPFVAPNDVSLRQAEETNAEAPGVARPFVIYADEKLVGFCMFAFYPEAEDPDDRYWLWRFMIDKNEQDKGYGRAALGEIIRYFKDNGADMLYLSTEPENERGLHIYHKAGFRETGIITDDEAVLMRMLKGPNRIVRDFYGIDVDRALGIRGKKGCGVSIAVHDEDGDLPRGDRARRRVHAQRGTVHEGDHAHPRTRGAAGRARRLQDRARRHRRERGRLRGARRRKHGVGHAGEVHQL